jgi:hypothetical protein
LNKIFRGMIVCRTEDGVSVVSESKVFVMLVAIRGESTARNISDRHKIE